MMQNSGLRWQPNNNKHITLLFFKTKKQFHATDLTKLKAVCSCNRTSLS